MIHRGPERRPSFRPGVDGLERRRLLAIAVASLGQDGADLVGPDASPGPDGVQDLHVKLSGLTGAPVASIVVRGPAGFAWDAGANPNGLARAEFFPAADGLGGDLYLNPVVASAALPNGSTLALTVNYQGGPSASDSGSVVVANLASPPLAMPEPSAPANVVANDFAVAALGQDGTSTRGAVHLKITGLNGRVISSATQSDPAGSYWSQSDTTGQHTLQVVEASNHQSADAWFAPTRDESAQPMALRLVFAADPLGASAQHLVAFAGGAWSPGLAATPLNGRVASGVATGAALAADLAASGAQEIDTIALQPGATIVLTGPLRITHSVSIVGNGATVLFAQGSTPWPASAPGAIYVANPGVSDISVCLQGFTVGFSLAGPLQWYASPGSSALFDPEASSYGARAVINTSVGNDGRNREVLTLSGMTINGPPAFDGAPPTPTDSSHVYAGEASIPLVEAGNDTGSITGSTFRGGAVQLAGGPWVVTGNTHWGSYAGMYTPSAFSLQSPHDVTFSGNLADQITPGGTLFRLVNLARSGYADSVSNNSFIGGQVGNEVTYVKTSATTGSYTGINDSEVILTEPGTFLFEGTPAAVSADGRLLVLPAAAAGVASRAFADASTGPGLVVTILSANNPDGSANPYAGTYYRVAQQVSGSPLTFLMQSPLPKGKYVISVVAGFVGDVFANNVVNLQGRSSTAIVLGGADFGTWVTGNVIEGGSIYTYPYTGGSILLRSGYVANDESAAGSPFPIGYGWSHYPAAGVTIANNFTFNSLGNVTLEVAHDAGEPSESGRRYLVATVAGNVFAWQQSYYAAWSSTFLALPNGSGNPGNLPSDGALPPTVTIGSGGSADGGYRSPWTSSLGFVDPAELGATVTANTAFLVPASGPSTVLSEPTGQVFAGTVNGIPYATYAYDTAHAPPIGDPSPYAPFNDRNLAIGQVVVNLAGAFNTVGTTPDGAGGPGNFDGHGNSYSATALGPAVTFGGATFAFGPAGVANAVAAAGQTIAVPPVVTSAVTLLGASSYGPSSGTFTLHYTDGTSSTASLTFSDWVNGYTGPGTSAPGEAIAAATPRTVYAGGTFAQPAYVYAHTLPVAQGKVVQSITLPNNGKIKILAIDLI